MSKLKAEENAVLCSCFDLSCQCHHCPEDDLFAGTQSRLLEDSYRDHYG